MTTILSRKLLPHQTDKFVLVKREDSIYQRVDNEYFKKRYFTSKEVCDMLEIPHWKLYLIWSKLGYKPLERGHKMRFTIRQARQIIELL